MGLGREGLNLLKFFDGKVKELTVLDGSTAKRLGEEKIKEARTRGAKLVLGENYLKNLERFDIIFRSPGVPLNLPEFKKVKNELSSLTRLFFSLCPATIIGVTGTKGKSTTASLIYHLLKGKYRRVFLGGNIGNPLLSLLPRLKKGDLVVLELSSFQLEDLNESPPVAVLLEVTPEHLDRHRSFSTYFGAKSNIYLHQRPEDWLVVSSQFASGKKAIKQAPGHVLEYRLPRPTSFSCGPACRQAGPFLGPQGLANMLPAVNVALLFQASPKVIEKRLKSFKPLPHRLEIVGKKGGVKFVNDSTATTPVATIAALESFPGPKVLIAGGISKKESFKELARVAKKTGVEGAVFIGGTTFRLLRAFHRYASSVLVGRAENLKEAVIKAYEIMKQSGGGTVLFSPACASFDMFKDAYDRGDKFKKTVKKLLKKE